MRYVAQKWPRGWAVTQIRPTLAGTVEEPIGTKRMTKAEAEDMAARISVVAGGQDFEKYRTLLAVLFERASLVDRSTPILYSAEEEMLNLADACAGLSFEQAYGALADEPLRAQVLARMFPDRARD